MSCCIVFAQYKPIPAHLTSQYKQEVEQIINNEYPKVIHRIDGYVEEAKTYRDKIKKGNCISQQYANMILISEISIYGADIEMYREILNVSEEKYLHKKHAISPSSDAYFLVKALSPYFKQCNISNDKLLKIEHYMKKKVKVVEKYIEEIEIYCK